jgi:hypothetical protein
MPREDSLVAGRAAAAEKAKTKTKKLSAETRKRYERAAAVAEKKVMAAEEQAKAGGLGAGAMAVAAATAREARARATTARDRLAAAVPSERHAASGRLGKAAQINGSVKHVNLSPDDREMVAEAERARAPWEDALEEMRRRGKGWMHSREVRGKAVVVLVDDPRSDRSRWTWYCEGGCGSADVLAKFTAFFNKLLTLFNTIISKWG